MATAAPIRSMQFVPTKSNMIVRRNRPINVAAIVKQVAEEMKARPARPKVNQTKVLQQPKKPKKKAEDAVMRVARRVNSIIMQPQLVITLVAIALALYIHHYHVDESIITKVVKKLKNNKTTTRLGFWVEENVPRFFGMVVTTAISFTSSTEYGLTISLLAALAIVMLPAMNVASYVITALFGLLFFKLRRPNDRYMINIAAMFAYTYYAIDGSVDGANNSTVADN